MALTVNPRCIQIREPGLLVPGKKPVGPVRVDESNKFAPRSGDHYWLLNNHGLDLISKTLGTIVNPSVTSFSRGGLYGTSNSSDGININLYPYINDDESSTVFAQVRAMSIPSNQSAIVGDYSSNGSNTNNYLYIKSTMQVVFERYGPGGGDLTSSSSFSVGQLLNIVVSTNGSNRIMAINGKVEGQDSANETWTNGPATVARIGDRIAGTNGFSGVIYSVGALQRSLSLADAISLSKDPYQFLIPA